MERETPEGLIGELVDFLGTSETCRALRLSAKSGHTILSKMKTPPDSRNNENGGHVVGVFERMQLIGEKLQIEIARAKRRGDTERAEAGEELRRNILQFVTEVFEAKAISDSSLRKIGSILKEHGIMVNLLLFLLTILSGGMV